MFLDSLTPEIEADRSGGRTDAERTIQGRNLQKAINLDLVYEFFLSFRLLFKHVAYHLGHIKTSSNKVKFILLVYKRDYILC